MLRFLLGPGIDLLVLQRLRRAQVCQRLPKGYEDPMPLGRCLRLLCGKLFVLIISAALINCEELILIRGINYVADSFGG